MPRALVVGCSGQDGTYLSELLLQKGYSLTGIDRHPPRIAEISFQSIDITEAEAVQALFGAVQPDEIYFLAAHHSASEQTNNRDFSSVTPALLVNTLALGHLLTACASTRAQTRLFYAASSRVFGNPPLPVQDEATPLNPICPYGISKTAGIHLCRYFRSCGTYASTGILYNHESPLRAPQFVSKKIVRGAVQISRGQLDRLVVSNLDAKVDWGWAPDYVEAMWAILQLDQPDDFIIASETLHSVRDLAAVAFATLDLDWQKFVVEESGHPLRVDAPRQSLSGSTQKLRRLTGWKPSHNFDQMVRHMVEAELAESLNERH